MHNSGTPLYRDIQIGTFRTSGNIFLAPLAGFSDAPFRKICIAYGASLCWSEMVSAEGLARGSEKTERLMQRGGNEQELVIQVFLSHYTQALRALPKLLSYRPSVIDINCGCPVPKVMKTGAGCSLMERPHAAAEIIRALKDSCSVPVSVKFRSGPDEEHISCFDFAETVRKAGASLLTLHPRTRRQGYSGHADWKLLSRLKEDTDLPVAGSGDVTSAEDAREMLAQTGVDGVMIGRGAIGNPFIFSRSKSLLTTGIDPGPPPAGELISVMLSHVDAHIAFVGEQRACREMRKHISSYTKGIPGGKQLRSDIVKASSREAYRLILQRLQDELTSSSS